jgi:hypothetical protein
MDPQLAQLVSSLKAERVLLQADDARKEVEKFGERSSSIQGLLPSSTADTLMYSLVGNLAIATAKFYVYLRSGHQAMFSEAVHTLVDVGNQAILAYGLREAAQAHGARFRQKFTLEDAIGSHACSLEANTRVTNGIPLGSSPLLPVDTVNCVATLKA